jgi:hypothetical protein
MRLEGSRVLPAYIILATTSLVLVESVEQSEKRETSEQKTKRVHTRTVTSEGPPIPPEVNR